jgi:hypothetical protein
MQHVRSAQLAHHAHLGAGLRRGLGHRCANRIAKGHVAYNPVAKKSRNAKEGSVNELVGHHKVGGLVLFLQRAHGRNRENALHAELLECVNVGAEVQLRGQNAMPASMPSKKRYAAALQLTQHKCV